MTTPFHGLTITNTDYDLEHGFFWVCFDNDKSIQCCLESRKDGQGFKKEISRRDSQYDNGLCLDCNLWAISEDDGWTTVEALLFKEARKLGIKII